jgi:Apolipoprotein N-acyltransferase
MRIKKYILPFLFGLIGIFAFSPFSIKFLIYVSYAYLIRLIFYSKNSLILKVFVWGLGHWGFGMSWLIVSIYYYGETNIILASIIFLLLVILLTTVFTCPLCLIIKLYKYIYFKNKIIKILYISSFFLSIELTRYFLLNGVPWLIPGDIS